MMIVTLLFRVKWVLENERSSYTLLREVYTQDQSKDGTKSALYTSAEWEHSQNEKWSGDAELGLGI